METVHPSRLIRGESPLLISVPHAGTAVPASIFTRLSEPASGLPDTDWLVDRLYDWAPACGAGMIVAPLSRYVVDLNRPPDERPLYSTKETSLSTSVVPLRTFAGDAVYQEGCEPDGEEVTARLNAYWIPYHQCLGEELDRIRRTHGHAVLLDAHSIRSRVPLLFEGKLPDLNLGSNGGQSAAPGLRARALSTLQGGTHTVVLDGRFKGGYITRHYGDPDVRVHALQLEMAQSGYMQEDPPLWLDDRVQTIQVLLRALVRMLMDWKPSDD